MSHITKWLTAAAVSALSLSIALPAQASDAHCFTGGYEAMEPEDRYAAGLMDDEREVAAMEDLIEDQWRLRLSGRNVIDARYERGLDVVAGDGRAAAAERYVVGPYESALADVLLHRENEISRRRTGSKYFYVTPQQKRLARQRAQLRSLKQKPCNPHILYLGFY